MRENPKSLEILEEMTTSRGDRLGKLTQEQAVMLVFLRHFGCVFCKEALADLAEQKEKIAEKGVLMVFVHMSEDVVAEKYFREYNLEGVRHISDPEFRYYTAFGITKGGFSQLYSLRSWMRGFAAKQEGHKLELSKALGDSTQMPGIFILKDREIRNKFIHKYASDRPDYNKLIENVVKPV